MSKKDDLKFELMSHIDEGLVDKVTERRIALFEKMKLRAALLRKRLIPIIAAAACCCFLVPIILFIFGGGNGGKQVPVYKGMTASIFSPDVSAESGGSALTPLSSINKQAKVSTLSSSRRTNNIENLKDDNGNHNGHDKNPEKETENGTDWEPDVSVENQLFYAEKGKDFYITVHIDNPDKFEIVSFTLNGEKYTSYMFEPGSDLENLILKCNAGPDVAGVVEYTIDAIKYIDGTKIKDVKIEGNQTIKVGLYSPDILPTAALECSDPTYDFISFSLKVSDAFSRIAMSEGNVSLILYRGGEIVSSTEIGIDEELYFEFKDLDPATEYRCAIVAVFDKLNGEGVQTYVLGERTFVTDDLLSAEIADIDFTSASLELAWHELAGENSISSIALYIGGEKVRDLPTDTTEITGLLSNTEYTLEIVYAHGEIERTILTAFSTKQYEVGLELETVEIQHEFFSFNITEIDEHGLGEIALIELYFGDELVSVLEDLSARTFGDLDSDKEYILKVTYKYDLQDGRGEQATVQEITVKTLRYPTPTISLVDVSSDKDKVSFGISEMDDNGHGEIEKIEIYLGDMLVKAATSTDTREITGLEPLNVYTLKVTYLYNLRDGEGDQRKVQTAEFITQTAGLEIKNGIVYGPGTATDSVLYINMPIMDNLAAWEGQEEQFKGFINNTAITEVHLGSGVTRVGLGAFSGCTSLGKVTFSDGVEFIGMLVFQNCSALEEVILPDSVTQIDMHAFRMCASLKNVRLPAALTSVSGGLFTGCSALTEVVIPDGVGKIGDAAFSGCTSLAKIVIPDSVVQIEAYAFSECTSLAEIVIPDSVVEIGNGAFRGCRSLKTVALPPALEAIADYTFYECISLKNVNIPDGVKTIGGSAFHYCESLENVGFPEGLETIGFYAFAECAFEEVVIPDSVTSMEMYVFFRCQNLKQVQLSKNLEAISDAAFYNCTSLESIVLPEGIASIGQHAFSQCPIVEIIIPDSVTLIDLEAFFRCNKLKKIQLPKNLVCIETGAFKFCNSLDDVILPEGLVTIGDKAFYSCSALDNIVIPDSVINMGQNVFYGTRIREITMPKSMTVIRNSSLAGNRYLNTINIPDTVTRIESQAFSGVTGLATINYAGTMEKWIVLSYGVGNLSGVTVNCSDGVITN